MEWHYQYKEAWNNIKIHVCTLMCMMLIACCAFSQPKFYTRVDQQVVGKNQPIQVQFVIENAKTILEFKPPSFNDFNVIQGPMQSSGMSVVNGNVTQYKSLIFLLQPKESGKLDIKGATARIDGHRMRSNNISIEVTNKNVAPSNPTPAFNFSFPGDRAEAEREFYLRPGENVIDKIKKNLFVKVEVNKTSCYVNEPIVATYKLYSRLRSESRVVKRPSYNGFSVYDMIEPDGSVATTETLNGKEYNVHLIRQSQLFPLQAGTYTLDPVEVENQVSFIRTNGDQANSFDEIFNPTGDEVDQTINLSSKPVTITVKPLPTENQPASFDGAVGNFKVSCALAKDTVHAGDLTNLTVKVSGKGNLPIINLSAIKLPDGFEAYDPKTTEDFHPESVPLSGAKTFKFPISATRQGDYVIEPIRFSFFDPSTKSYKTDSTRALSINVLPPIAIHVKKQEASPLLTTGVRIPESILIGVVSLTVLVLLAIALVFYRRAEKRKRIAREEMLARERAKAALRVDPLDKARMLVFNGDHLAFLKEMENVIWKKTADSLSIPRALLNQPRVIEELKSRGVEDTAQLFRALVNTCETMLYIPGSQAENLQDVLSMTEVYFAKLDSLKAS
jgi:hypothetical protein